MKILKGNYGECRFCDNMDAEFGLPSLQNQSIQFCFTDFPYNVQYKNKDCSYEDNKENYVEWIQTRWKQIQRITESQIITVGSPNDKLWYSFAPPMDKIYHHKPDGQGIQKYNYLNKIEEVYLYNLPKRYPMNYIKASLDLNHRWNHPCPKSYKLCKHLIEKQLPMISIMDICLGSGTIAQIAEELGIKWLGYEIMEEYAPDIDKRIQLGIKSHVSYLKNNKKQQTLFK